MRANCCIKLLFLLMMYLLNGLFMQVEIIEVCITTGVFG